MPAVFCDEITLFESLESGHLRIQALQLFNAVRIDLLTLPAAAAGTDIADDTHITADGVTINGMVDGTIADAEIMRDRGPGGMVVPGI